ncbi:hypothetical protein [Enterobacter wuhouensis]|uniref:Uncharacterized protein n=1 Tax=Enterobacter wuhouensis TaxID=2529381 RepID=A0A4V2LU83_9ENTR|nr:hypothetical protein [Enterobacter wuhouensis]TCB87745.1 hypothetical protein E0L20_22320 [Enterobacter wuhouensis]
MSRRWTLTKLIDLLHLSISRHQRSAVMRRWRHKANRLARTLISQQRVSLALLKQGHVIGAAYACPEGRSVCWR